MTYLLPGDRFTVTAPTFEHRDLYGMRGTITAVYPTILGSLDEADEEPFQDGELTVGITTTEAINAIGDHILAQLA